MQPNDPHIMDYVLAIIAVGALVIGVLSMLFGWVQDRWWKFIDWWHEAPAYHMSTGDEWSDDETGPVARNFAALRRLPTPISHNNPLRIAERAKIEAIALLIVESRRKAFQNGKVPETRSLKTVFGVSASSDEGSDYQRLRAQLLAEIARIDPPAIQFPDPENGGRVPASYPVSGRQTR